MRKEFTSERSPVLFFADADDAGVARLVSHLERRLRVTWWRFGLPEGLTSVDADKDGFRLEQPDTCICSQALRDAKVIVYRRRLMQPRPLVVSNLPSVIDRAFSEREWASLIEGLLLVAERESDVTWLNRPSVTLLTQSKLALIIHAARTGFPVPPFSVSTPVRFPAVAREHLVTKAISVNERIDATRYFSTTLLSSEDLRDLPGARLPTPSLLQEYVPSDTELRIFYILGEFLCIGLTPSRHHIDIRHASPAELAPHLQELPTELRDPLTALAGAFGLGYCTFDLAATRNGLPALLDITPNGDWDHFESDAEPVISEFLADRIAAQALGEAGD